MYLIHCQNFCKCHNVPLPSTIKQCKNKKIRKRSKKLKIKTNKTQLVLWSSEKGNGFTALVRRWPASADLRPMTLTGSWVQLSFV
jgi:hypothetical protein